MTWVSSLYPDMCVPCKGHQEIRGTNKDSLDRGSLEEQKKPLYLSWVSVVGSVFQSRLLSPFNRLLNTPLKSPVLGELQ